jgi:hypothetical protein
MKTPTVDDPKPQQTLGPTGPAKVSGGERSKGKESNTAGSAPAGEPGKSSELETTIDRKRRRPRPIGDGG